MKLPQRSATQPQVPATHLKPLSKRRISALVILLLLSSADALQDSDLSSLNGNDAEALLDSVSTNSSTQQNLPPGFSDLDSLLGYSGGLPANTDPVLMPTDLLFAYDKVDVLGGARLSLMKLGILIQKNPHSTFIIEGHSDSFGDNNYNMQLSLRRAHAVKNWLVQSLRLNGSRILIRGRGEEKPLVSQQGSIAQQSLNRRVEIIIEK